MTSIMGVEGDDRILFTDEGAEAQVSPGAPSGSLLEGEGEQAELGAQAPDSGGQAGHVSLVGASCSSGLGGSGQF